MASLSLRLLGGFHATIDKEPLPNLGYDKVRLLLAYLAVEPGPHRRGYLAECLWPDQDETKARQNLRQALAWLRRALGDQHSSRPFLATDRYTVRLNPESDIQLDIAAFMAERPGCDPADPVARSACRRWHEAMARDYRGPFLANLSVEVGPEFEDWIETRRAFFHRAALDALYRLTECHKRTGEYQLALTYARQQLSLEPWRESAHRQVMECLAKSNNRLAALAQFEECRLILEAELGTAPAPRTRELLESIRAEATANGSAVAGPSHREAVEPAERRQVTALFCGLADTMDLDPERLPELWALYQECCTRVITRTGGYIAQQREGALLVYFGVPTALEDAARQAVRTGLELVAEMPAGISIRVGVDTGMVVISREGPGRDGIIGSVPRIATQLQEHAANGTVVVSQATYRIIRDFCEVRRLGRFKLRDFSRRLTVYQVEAIAPATRCARRGARPLFGRDEVLARLDSAREDVLAGEPRGIVLTGEPGLGKTRILQALRRSAAEGGQWRAFTFRPDDRGLPCGAVMRLLREGLGERDGRRRSAGWQGEPVLRRHGWARSRRARLMATIGGFETAPAGLTGDQRRLLLEALWTWMTNPDGTPPAVILEDLHWVDASSLELLSGCLSRLLEQAALFVGTVRRQHQVPFLRELPLERIDLNPLRPRSIRALVNALAGGDISEPIREAIVRCADGVPWFAEEMTWLAVSRGGDAFNGNDGPTVPGRIRDYLAARLQDLEGDRELAHLMAVIGREIDKRLLHAAARLDPMLRWDPPTVDEATARLLSMGYLEAGGPGPGGMTLRFRYWLEWQHAYWTQIHRLRLQRHELIARLAANDIPELTGKR